MNLRRGLAVGALAAIVSGVAVDARATALEQQQEHRAAEARGVAELFVEEQRRADALQEQVAQREQEIAAQERVLAARPDFVDAVSEAREVLVRAEGRVPTAQTRQVVLAAQDVVRAERTDQDVVQEATDDVRAAVAELRDDVETIEQAGAGGDVPWGAAGSAAFLRMRETLDHVGGEGVPLFEAASCAGADARACANSNGYIKYSAEIVGWDDAALRWAMAHELAHIFQFRVWSELSASGSYQELFGGDPEFLANCMALVRGFPGSVSCDAAQQDWASSIWDGVVG